MQDHDRQGLVRKDQRRLPARRVDREQAGYGNLGDVPVPKAALLRLAWSKGWRDRFDAIHDCIAVLRSRHGGWQAKRDANPQANSRPSKGASHTGNICEKFDFAGPPRGLDTRGSGGQVSTPSIRFRRSYPQTRDGVAFHTPLATLLSTPHS